MRLFVALLSVASANAFCRHFQPFQGNLLEYPRYTPTPVALRRDGQESAVSSTQLFAKKKKAKKTKKAQKQSGFEWATSFSLKPFEAKPTRELVTTAVASYEGRTGKPLCDDIVGVADIPKALWKAPLACIVVDKKNEDDDSSSGGTEVIYANLAALETVGLTGDQWDQLMVSPGPKGDSESEFPNIVLDLPSQMKETAYESGYQKKMVRKNKGADGEDVGHDIGVVDAERWKLEKSALVDGAFVTQPLGVAYAWKEWVLDDTTVCAPGGVRREMINTGDLQGAVDEQAGRIRSLKEEQGLGNKDPQVQEAVAELLRLKAMLEASQ